MYPTRVAVLMCSVQSRDSRGGIRGTEEGGRGGGRRGGGGQGQEISNSSGWSRHINGWLH